MKYCGTCESYKNVSEFHKRKASNDGLCSKCKTCQKVYDKARVHHAHRVEARAIYAQTDEGRIASNRAKAEWRKRNPEKSRAHRIIAYHVRKGNITRQACEACGNNETHAHHDDYSKPLNVRWLCNEHHAEWHRLNG